MAEGNSLKELKIGRQRVCVRSTATLAAVTIVFSIGISPVSRGWSAPSLQQHPGVISQSGESEDTDKEVPPSQVDKYINVYQAMQKDHNLTVEQAAAKEGLTVAQFRELEGRIERDDTLRERVRKALRHAANPNATDPSDQ